MTLTGLNVYACLVLVIFTGYTQHICICCFLILCKYTAHTCHFREIIRLPRCQGLVLLGNAYSWNSGKIIPASMVVTLSSFKFRYKQKKSSTREGTSLHIMQSSQGILKQSFEHDEPQAKRNFLMEHEIPDMVNKGHWSPLIVNWEGAHWSLERLIIKTTRYSTPLFNWVITFSFNIISSNN